MAGCTTSHYPPNTRFIRSCDGFRKLSRWGATAAIPRSLKGGRVMLTDGKLGSYTANGSVNCALANPLHVRSSSQGHSGDGHIEGEDDGFVAFDEDVPCVFFFPSSSFGLSFRSLPPRAISSGTSAMQRDRASRIKTGEDLIGSRGQMRGLELIGGQDMTEGDMRGSGMKSIQSICRYSMHRSCFGGGNESGR